MTENVVPFAAPSIKIGTREVKRAEDTMETIAGMIWGPSGVGKTSYLCTAPGRKLIVNFDPQGTTAVAHRTDVDVLDYSADNASAIEELRTDDAGGLGKYLDTHPETQTVIIDSLTTLTQMAMYRAIEIGGVRNMTLETPGLQGYGRRNIIMLDVFRRIMSCVLKRKRHFFATAHENDPERDKEGVILYISIMLGGQLTNHMGLRISECWYMSEKDKVRKIAIRPCRMHRPMKSRMFDMNGEPEFVLKYDQHKPDEESPHTIAKFYEQWRDSGGKKLQVPK